jgi:hypothetical protein
VQAPCSTRLIAPKIFQVDRYACCRTATHEHIVSILKTKLEAFSVVRRVPNYRGEKQGRSTTQQLINEDMVSGLTRVGCEVYAEKASLALRKLLLGRRPTARIKPLIQHQTACRVHRREIRLAVRLPGCPSLAGSWRPFTCSAADQNAAGKRYRRQRQTG